MEAIVFDLDDTLYLERDYVRSGLRAVDRLMRDEGTRGLYEVAWPMWQAGERRRLFDAALPRIGLAPVPERVDRLVHAYRAHRPTIALCRDARACLDRWRRVPMAIITDGFAEAQRAKLAALGLDRAPVAVALCTAEAGAGRAKPHPFAFETVQRRLGTASSRTVYVADNPAKDFLAPRSLGWRTIQIDRAGAVHPRRPPSRAHAADLTITSLDALDAALEAVVGRPA